MTASPFSKIIFPAILTSSTVFAALTLSLTALESNRVTRALPIPVQEGISSLLNPEHEKVSIRYIGFSILASVGTGVGIAELMRIQQARRQRQSDLLQLLEDSESAKSTTEADWRSGETVQLGGNSADLFSPSKQVNWLSGLEDTAIPSWPTSDDSKQEQPLAAFTALSAPLSLSQFSQSRENRSFKKVSSPIETLTTESITVKNQLHPTSSRTQELSLPTLDEVSQHTCRIKIRGSQERLLALQLEEKYYSFFRVRASLEQALTVVSNAKKRGEAALVTPHARGYAVWVYQPDARLDSADWENWRLTA